VTGVLVDGSGQALVALALVSEQSKGEERISSLAVPTQVGS
jgi:hypothetical protein